MAKVYGLHEVELVPGADPVEFEQLASELAKGHGYKGWNMYLLKGERGERNGKYLIMLEIESLEARNRYAPSPDGPGSAEAEELDRRNATLWERLRAIGVDRGRGRLHRLRSSGPVDEIEARTRSWRKALPSAISRPNCPATSLWLFTQCQYQSLAFKPADRSGGGIVNLRARTRAR